MNLLVGELSPSQRFWRFFTAGAVSNTGTAVTAVALPLIAVITLQSSPVEVGLLTAASYAAWLVLGLPAGVIVARLPLRGTQVVMDLARAAAIVSVPVAYATGSLTLVHLALVALVVSLASVLFDVGAATFLPSVVPPEERTKRNSLMSVSHSLTDMGGPTLGGVLVQLVGAVRRCCSTPSATWSRHSCSGRFPLRPWRPRARHPGCGSRSDRGGTTSSATP